MNQLPSSHAAPLSDEARLHRWRLVLGGEADSSCGKLSGVPAEMDQALYDPDGKNGLGTSCRGGRGGSAPSVVRWLGDIRKYFPGSVVQVIPASTKDTAHMVVRKVVDALLKKLEEPMRSAVTGALDRSPQQQFMNVISQRQDLRIDNRAELWP